MTREVRTPNHTVRESLGTVSLIRDSCTLPSASAFGSREQCAGGLAGCGRTLGCVWVLLGFAGSLVPVLPLKFRVVNQGKLYFCHRCKLLASNYFPPLYEKLCTLASSSKLKLMYSLLSTSVKLQKQQVLTVYIKF